MTKKIGRQSLRFENVFIKSWASAAGPTEKKGCFGSYYDFTIPDALFGENSFEAAEKRLFTECVKTLLKKAALSIDKVDCLIGGDLLNQIVTSAYGARDLDLPFLGIYGACSTMAEAMLLSSIQIDGGFAENILCGTSSHFGSAERQFRFPLELGTPKPPTAQNTVTGTGVLLLSDRRLAQIKEETRIRITSGTIGKPVDPGIKDANNMGAAMAPAAASTIAAHLRELQKKPEDYDIILTGDLGTHGSDLLHILMEKLGFDIRKQHKDCGAMVFAGLPSHYSGGSGCGCCASSLASYFLSEMQKEKFRRILFVATGALLSPTVVQQGETIPGIAHAVSIELAEKHSENDISFQIGSF